MKIFKILGIFLAALVLPLSVSAQGAGQFVAKKGALTETQLKRWSHLDLAKDSIPGMSVDKAYSEFIKNRKGSEVIVGIVDSGVDIEHEDLKSLVWTNKKEIPGNKKDDDKNGYVDDIHGWNFLGNITKEHLEYERIIKNKSIADDAVYNQAVSLKNKKLKKALSGKKNLDEFRVELKYADSILVKQLGKTDYTIEDLQKINSTDPEVLQSKAGMEQMLSYAPNVSELNKVVDEEYQHYMEVIEPKDADTDYRKILGDNPDDFKDTKYGDNNVMGPDKKEILHGTHVAGIVAGVRNNNLGGDGVSNNVKILTVRAVPDGDEYDKDIALGIRYAVDNGAKVINASFGKSFSPHKQWVYDAIKYAESKDVLIVHAAGNDASNIDVENNFPNDAADNETEFADNVITVGALNYEYGQGLAADFSNYGKSNVDVFAPGVKIYSSVPNNGYEYEQGTSMASPNVAGVAALIRSYFPKLTATQVKHIIMDSGTLITEKVVVGGNPYLKKPFSDLSKSGRIVNAYNALLMADQMSKNKISNKTVKG